MYEFHTDDGISFYRNVCEYDCKYTGYYFFIKILKVMGFARCRQVVTTVHKIATKYPQRLIFFKKSFYRNNFLPKRNTSNTG